MTVVVDRAVAVRGTIHVKSAVRTTWWCGRLGGVMARLVESFASFSLVVSLRYCRGVIAGRRLRRRQRRKLKIDIDLSSQTMRVDGGFFNRHTWRVSTARPGYRTPVGKYRPTRLERMWYSSKYENSPMPYSIFFLGGYAIHGTYEVKRLGRAVSHGCIRLASEQCPQALRAWSNPTAPRIPSSRSGAERASRRRSNRSRKREKL